LQGSLAEGLGPLGEHGGLVRREGQFPIIGRRLSDQYRVEGAERGGSDVRAIAHIAESHLGSTPLETGGCVWIADKDADLALAGEQRFDDGDSDLGVGSDDDHGHGAVSMAEIAEANAVVGMVGDMTRTRALVSIGAVIFTALLAAAMWQYATRLCTKAGCSSTVGYSIPEEAYEAWGVEREAPLVIETCVDQDCSTAQVTRYAKGGCCRVEGKLLVVDDSFGPDTEYLVTLKVTDPQGMVRYARTDSGVTLEKTQPNGPSCSPTCFWWGIELTPEDLGL